MRSRATVVLIVLVAAVGVASIGVACSGDERPTVEPTTVSPAVDEVQLVRSYNGSCEFGWMFNHEGTDWFAAERPSWDGDGRRTGVVVSLSEEELVFRDRQDGAEVRFVPDSGTETACS